MAWLGTWLQSLVIAVLLAICLDFILPTQHLGRYVKTVMGLFILLIFMSPILSLSKTSFRLDTLMEHIYRALHGESYSQSNIRQQEQSASLSSILQNSEQLQSANRQQAVIQTELAIAEDMHRRLQAELQIPMDVVKVKLMQRPDDQIEFEHVEVSLRVPAQRDRVPSARGGASEKVSVVALQESSAPYVRITPVQPVQPVAPVHDQQHATNTTTAGSYSSMSPDDQQWVDQQEEKCIAVLTRYWPVDASQISVRGQVAVSYIEVSHE